MKCCKIPVFEMPIVLPLTHALSSSSYPLAGIASVAFDSFGKVLMESPCKSRTQCNAWLVQYIFISVKKKKVLVLEGEVT